MSRGKLTKDNAFWNEVGQIFDRLRKLGRRDVSFKQFVETYCKDRKLARAKEMALSFVEGFDAAPADRIGTIHRRRPNRFRRNRRRRILPHHRRLHAHYRLPEAIAGPEEASTLPPQCRKDRPLVPRQSGTRNPVPARRTAPTNPRTPGHHHAADRRAARRNGQVHSRRPKDAQGLDANRNGLSRKTNRQIPRAILGNARQNKTAGKDGHSNRWHSSTAAKRLSPRGGRSTPSAAASSPPGPADPRLSSSRISRPSKSSPRPWVRYRNSQE